MTGTVEAAQVKVVDAGELVAHVHRPGPVTGIVSTPAGAPPARDLVGVLMATIFAKALALEAVDGAETTSLVGRVADVVGVVGFDFEWIRLGVTPEG